jgi:hypothetical protein
MVGWQSTTSKSTCCAVRAQCSRITDGTASFRIRRRGVMEELVRGVGGNGAVVVCVVLSCNVVFVHALSLRATVACALRRNATVVHALRRSARSTTDVLRCGGVQRLSMLVRCLRVQRCPCALLRVVAACNGRAQRLSMRCGRVHVARRMSCVAEECNGCPCSRCLRVQRLSMRCLRCLMRERLSMRIYVLSIRSEVGNVARLSTRCGAVRCLCARVSLRATVTFALRRNALEFRCRGMQRLSKRAVSICNCCICVSTRCL